MCGHGTTDIRCGDNTNPEWVTVPHYVLECGDVLCNWCLEKQAPCLGKICQDALGYKQPCNPMFLVTPEIKAEAWQKIIGNLIPCISSETWKAMEQPFLDGRYGNVSGIFLEVMATFLEFSQSPPSVEKVRSLTDLMLSNRRNILDPKNSLNDMYPYMPRHAELCLEAFNKTMMERPIEERMLPVEPPNTPPHPFGVQKRPYDTARDALPSQFPRHDRRSRVFPHQTPFQKDVRAMYYTMKDTGNFGDMPENFGRRGLNGGTARPRSVPGSLTYDETVKKAALHRIWKNSFAAQKRKLKNIEEDAVWKRGGHTPDMKRSVVYATESEDEDDIAGSREGAVFNRIRQLLHSREGAVFNRPDIHTMRVPETRGIFTGQFLRAIRQLLRAIRPQDLQRFEGAVQGFGKALAGLGKALANPVVY
jgi:hypothetical protein